MVAMEERHDTVVAAAATMDTVAMDIKWACDNERRHLHPTTNPLPPLTGLPHASTPDSRMITNTIMKKGQSCPQTQCCWWHSHFFILFMQL